MTSLKTKILLIEDNQLDARLVKEYLFEQPDFLNDLVVSETLAAGIHALKDTNFDIILLDLNLPDSTGIDTFENVLAINQDVPIILLTGLDDELIATIAIQKGAQDYLVKNQLNGLLLIRAIRYSIERKKSQLKIKESDSQFRTLWNNTKMGVVVIDSENLTITRANPKALEMIGVSEEALLGKKCQEYICAKKEGQCPMCDFNQSIENAEQLLLRENGEPLLILKSVQNMILNGRDHYVESFVDITERKQAEIQIKRLNRVYALLSNINQTIVRIHNLNQLFNDVCRIAVEVGEFQNASILLLNHKTELFETKAKAGIKNSFDDPSMKNSLFYNEFEQSKHIISNNIENDKNLPNKWKLNALTNGLKSYALFPLRIKGKLKGAFCLYSNELDFFDEMELELLDEMAKDISFAIEFIENKDDRHRFEEELYESRIELNEYFENDISGDYLCSTDGKILNCNRTFLKLFGFILNTQANDYSITQLFKNLDEWDTIKALLNKNRKIENYETDFVSIDGKIIPALINVVGIFNAKAELIKVRGYIVDITKLKMAQNEVLKLSRAMEQSPVSILITDLQGNIEYGNPKTFEITGYSPEELLGKNPRILSSCEKPKNEYKILWDTITSGKVWNGEFHNKKKNGKLYWENASISPIYNDANIMTHYIAIKEDITERKKIDRELISAKEKAEQSDQLKTAFLSNMSHEIRTPMNAILGFSQLLIGGNISEEDKQVFTEFIRINGESLVKIIDDIIDISKLHSKQLTIKESNFDLHILLAELISYYNQILLEKSKNKIEITLKLPDNAAKEFIINSDELRLKQILNNIVSNAIKYTDKGKITLGYEFLENKLQFYVKDTGIGIALENQKQIFERFVQLSTHYIARREGTGLGLPISKELVGLLGGELKVDSVVGKGSKFYFSLPIKAIKSINVNAARLSRLKQTVDLSRFKILIADDEESNYVLTNRLLNVTKVETEWAQNGLNAVEMVNKNAYDLIVMDVKMPEMDGIEATRLIKKHNANIPIIMQTAFAMPEVKEEAFKAGCDGFIVKPILLNDFMDIVNKHLLKE